MGAWAEPVLPLARRVERFPYVPADPGRRDERCNEVYNIQVQALVQRLSQSGLKKGDVFTAYTEVAERAGRIGTALIDRGIEPGTPVGILMINGPELLTLAYLRHRFFQTSFARSFLAITVGGAAIAALSGALGFLAAG